MSRSPALLLALLLAIPRILGAGDLDPRLRNRLARATPTERVRALIVLQEQVDLALLDAGLSAERATRRERHEMVVRALRSLAAGAQPPILAALERGEAVGHVGRVRPFWIANMIRCEGTAEALEALARRFDVATIYAEPTIALIEGTGPGRPAPGGAASVEPGLIDIRADSLWRAGYTGAGRLVCNLDTGVQGTHPALSARWRGNEPGVTAEEAWFDPYGTSSTPVDDDTHGTHTMGIITGRDSAAGDTVGVAPDAQWIAANVFEGSQTTGSAFLEAFEWTIDPDGDPSTLDDAPDVVSNSWGSQDPSCFDTYWRVIDANEVAGVAIVFSAGNSGPGPETITSPASRIESPVNVLAVGAVDAQRYVAGFSSRGPSPCDETTIKPEVMAPGVGVRSAYSRGGYVSLSGTSMAAPHVAGALALLRQVNPEATVGEIKEALLTTAVDLGVAGEDNNSGMGIIDCVEAALSLLPPAGVPYAVFRGAEVQDGGNGLPEPGETFDLVVYIGNLGESAAGLSARLATADPFVTLLADSSGFGDIPTGGVASNAGSAYRVELSDLTPGSHLLEFTLEVTANGGAYARTLPFSLSTPFVITMADHNVGDVVFSISDAGRYGYDDLDLTNGSGLVYIPVSPSLSWLFEGALVVGNDTAHVSHAARSTPAGPTAADWQVAPGGNVVISTPGSLSDQDGLSVFSDIGAPTPMDLRCRQRSFAFASAPDNNFILLEMTFLNTAVDSLAVLDSLYAGLYFDWDIGPTEALSNKAGMDRSRDLAYMWNPTNSARPYMGCAVLSEPGLVSYDIINNQDGSYGFTRRELYGSLSGGIRDSLSLGVADYSHILGTGPFSVAAGESVTVAFGVCAARTLADLQATAEEARRAYEAIITPTGIAGPGEPVSPRPPAAFALGPNYPNPFNPSTLIPFSVPGAGEGTEVRLAVYDLRGGAGDGPHGWPHGPGGAPGGLGWTRRARQPRPLRGLPGAPRGGRPAGPEEDAAAGVGPTAVCPARPSGDPRRASLFLPPSASTWPLARGVRQVGPPWPFTSPEPPGVTKR